MNTLEDIGKLIGSIGETADIGALSTAVETALLGLGFRYFACLSHDALTPSPRREPALHNYPPAWVAQYQRDNRARSDPILGYACRRIAPFFWSDPGLRQQLRRDQAQLLKDAKTHGLVNGFTVPMHLPGAFFASFSVIPVDGARRPWRCYAAVQILAPYVHERARQLLQPLSASGKEDQHLTPRERECLELVAMGKSDWAIAGILGISERTVHNHVERAKRRYRVSTRTQAVVCALFGAQISLDANIGQPPNH